MAADPILILQLHRMGDLILTFPLLLRLQRLYPGHPLWVAAEPRFFKELMPLAPPVTFFPPSHCDVLARQHYAAAINLSSAPTAARCMASLDAPLKLGPVACGPGLRVAGFWQLYRAALTQNNRHNAFHWADLHMLDLSPAPDLRGVPHARPSMAGQRRVGLVLGASEEAKRPDAPFWARLAVRLAAQGTFPILLGGPGEIPLGQEVERRSGLRGANFCGRLPLREVASLMRTLDLCVTPDTGPMHLADFLGVPVLNLSMGPVHARETGPTAPGQWVLRAAMSCAGCWQCGQGRLRCKAAFSPAAVARLALRLMEAGARPAAGMAALAGPALDLYRTDRDALGLHSLTWQGATPESRCRPLLEDLWQAVFLYFYNADGENRLRRQAALLQARRPRLAEGLANRLSALCGICARHLRDHSAPPADFWRAQPGLTRLFTGYLHMYLQNADFSDTGWRTALDCLGQVAAIMADRA